MRISSGVSATPGSSDLMSIRFRAVVGGIFLVLANYSKTSKFSSCLFPTWGSFRRRKPSMKMSHDNYCSLQGIFTTKMFVEPTTAHANTCDFFKRFELKRVNCPRHSRQIVFIRIWKLCIRVSLTWSIFYESGLNLTKELENSTRISISIHPPVPHS